MATIHPEAKLVYVAAIGEGVHYLRIHGKDGSSHVYTLTLDRCLQLIGDLTYSARDLAEPHPKTTLRQGVGG
jgi:hypothetical protein